MEKTFPQALTIAGSDSGGGAGIQADLKTMQMRHIFGMSVITAVTAQNTTGVTDIHSIPLNTIASQIQAIADDFSPRAYKIGMVGNAEAIHCIADALQHHKEHSIHGFGLCVLDPVMIAKGGAPLLENSAISALVERLVPMADIITPNIPEAEALTGMSISSANECLQDVRYKVQIHNIAKKIQEMGAKTVIIKGGHGTSEFSSDYVLTAEGDFTLTAPRFDTKHTHGTGCTFSACITAELAKGKSVEHTIRTAKAFITSAIRQPLGIGHGHGPTNHWAYENGL